MSNPERMAKLNELAKVSNTVIFKIDKVLMDGTVANKSNEIWKVLDSLSFDNELDVSVERITDPTVKDNDATVIIKLLK